MVLLSDVAATKKRRRFTQRTWNGTDIAYIAFMAAMHGLCLLAPATFSWPMVALFAASYLVTGCLGITLSFHRQLSHKAFATPKWLEYAFAYCGVLAIQARGALGFLEQLCRSVALVCFQHGVLTAWRSIRKQCALQKPVEIASGVPQLCAIELPR